MDDGVKLGATVALPSRDGETAMRGKFPVVLGMTPYGRTGLCSCYPPDFWAIAASPAIWCCQWGERLLP
jgi:predicted acyl esterase